jgi:hypothetical protein
MNLTIRDDPSPSIQFDIDLGEPSETGYFDASDLGPSSGNLYLFVDEKEVGSLFFFFNDGRLSVSLGKFDEESMEWIETNPIIMEKVARNG